MRLQWLFKIIHMYGDLTYIETQLFSLPFGRLNISFKIGRRPSSSWYLDRHIKTRTHKSVFHKGSTAKRLKTKRWAVLDSTVSFSHYVYLWQGIHNRTFCRHTQNKFPFLQAKGVISTARMGWFSRALTCFARSNILEKNCAIARRKNIMPFYPARSGINFP